VKERQRAKEEYSSKWFKERQIEKRKRNKVLAIKWIRYFKKGENLIVTQSSKTQRHADGHLNKKRNKHNWKQKANKVKGNRCRDIGEAKTNTKGDPEKLIFSGWTEK